MALTDCGITSGITFTCDDKQKNIGGFKSKFWIYNLDEINESAGNKGFDYDVNGYITAIYFDQYGGLYEFTSAKFTTSATSSMIRTEGAGIAIFPVTFTAQFFDTTPEQKSILEELANADRLGVIAERSAGVFELFGQSLGLNMAADGNEKNYGQVLTDNTARTVILEGQEVALPKTILINNDSTDTLAYIESLVV